MYLGVTLTPTIVSSTSPVTVTGSPTSKTVYTNNNIVSLFQSSVIIRVIKHE